MYLPSASDFSYSSRSASAKSRTSTNCWTRQFIVLISPNFQPNSKLINFRKNLYLSWLMWKSTKSQSLHIIHMFTESKPKTRLTFCTNSQSLIAFYLLCYFEKINFVCPHMWPITLNQKITQNKHGLMGPLMFCNPIVIPSTATLVLILCYCFEHFWSSKPSVFGSLPWHN